MDTINDSAAGVIVSWRLPPELNATVNHAIEAKDYTNADLTIAAKAGDAFTAA